MEVNLAKIRLIQDILRNNVIAHPNKVALICEDRKSTYSQIDEMSNRLANALIQNGIKNGDRVLFYLMNSVELVVSIFAVLKANAIFTVIDYANTFDTLRYIADDCEATALVTYDHQEESAARLLHDLHSLRFIILTGKNLNQPDFNQLGFETIQENYPSYLPPQRRIDCDLAYLTYTSGSTGKSKGVLVTHRSSLFTICGGMEYLSLSESDVHTSPLPLSFTMGINQLFQTFLAGGTLILEKSFAYPAMTLKRMENEGATGFACVPTVLNLLLQTDINRYDLNHLRFIISMGAALPLSLIRQVREKFPQTLFCSAYGMAEAAFSLGLEPSQIDRRPTSVGKPTPGIQAWIVNEKGQRLGPGEIGELVVRGSHVRSGYWNDPVTSTQHFRPGPLPGELIYFTGDIFRLDEEGYFYFIGRNDEIIKSGAKKVAPKEIENALYSLNGVLEAAAIGISDPLLGQAIKAFVVLDEHAHSCLTEQDVLKHCHQTLESYKVPQQIVIRESLPKTPSGKIKKTDLI